MKKEIKAAKALRKIERLARFREKCKKSLAEWDNITLQLPIKKIKTNSKYYKLIITDADGINHYFHFDDTYDGHSIDLDEPMEINEN